MTSSGTEFGNRYQSTIAGKTALMHPLAQTGRGVMSDSTLVSIVDDDESVRESLPDLLAQFGFSVQAFSSAEEFLASGYVEHTHCLILDIAMPGMSGPDLKRELTLRRRAIPIVFITAHPDDTVRPRMIAAGAVDCLFKPFSETALLQAVNGPPRRPSR